MQISILDKKGGLPRWLPDYVKVEDLPGHTFVAVHGGESVAIAGLRLCEGPICILDSLATNSSCSPSIRHKAIDGLVETIKARAVTLGFKTLIAYTRDSSVLSRSFRHGFRQQPDILIVKDL